MSRTHRSPSYKALNEIKFDLIIEKEWDNITRSLIKKKKTWEREGKMASILEKYHW